MNSLTRAWCRAVIILLILLTYAALWLAFALRFHDRQKTLPYIEKNPARLRDGQLRAAP